MHKYFYVCCKNLNGTTHKSLDINITTSRVLQTRIANSYINRQFANQYHWANNTAGVRALAGGSCSGCCRQASSAVRSNRPVQRHDLLSGLSPPCAINQIKFLHTKFIHPIIIGACQMFGTFLSEIAFDLRFWSGNVRILRQLV